VTGKQGTLLASGETFEDVEQHRSSVALSKGSAARPMERAKPSEAASILDNFLRGVDQRLSGACSKIFPIPSVRLWKCPMRTLNVALSVDAKGRLRVKNPIACLRSVTALGIPAVRRRRAHDRNAQQQWFR
jgi:hypothetical protein